MWSINYLIVPTLATQVLAITSDFVLTCPVAYADGTFFLQIHVGCVLTSIGGLYLRETKPGSYTPDLGGLLPASETFQLASTSVHGSTGCHE